MGSRPERTNTLDQTQNATQCPIQITYIEMPVYVELQRTYYRFQYLIRNAAIFSSSGMYLQFKSRDANPLSLTLLT